MSTVAAHGASKNLNVKTLLLKIPYTSYLELGRIKMDLKWEPTPYQLVLNIRRSYGKLPKGNSNKLYDPAATPTNHSHVQNGKIF